MCPSSECPGSWNLHQNQEMGWLQERHLASRAEQAERLPGESVVQGKQPRPGGHTDPSPTVIWLGEALGTRGLSFFTCTVGVVVGFAPWGCCEE